MIHTESTYLEAGNLKRLHVNQQVIKSNLANDEDEPALTIQYRGEPYRAHEAEWDGPSRLVYADPLSCGARVWIETRAAVRTIVR
jgi:hypothetical protein